ncbi:hypothetical protein [Sphingobacterium cellulitidis]|uniref:hypothetical protein n=1 Tax=Sphingobacterium cellulitidis TaxID=1768011 RepID=UPI0015C5B950|nr:hypothetical protein [Sphingobacterium cellulitidis]
MNSIQIQEAVGEWPQFLRTSFEKTSNKIRLISEEGPEKVPRNSNFDSNIS